MCVRAEVLSRGSPGNDRPEELARIGRGDFCEFGALMAASHATLRADYEVSCAELDAMVATMYDQLFETAFP